MHDPAIQLLYQPLNPELRRQSITLGTGITKPLAEAAILLLYLTPWLSPRHLSIPIGVLLVGWVAIDWDCWRRFVQRRD